MSKSKKELWRLRLNWCFIILASPIYSITTTGISSSFHQFVTNPRAEDLENKAGNHTETQNKMEPGLGESELFYSLLISGFNFGAMIGGITMGFLIRCIPQWHLWLITLLAHTVGYVIYCLASQGWLVMISKLLSGYFLGADVTLGFSYLSLTSVQYVEIQKERGEKIDDKSAIRLRNTLFAINGISYSVGYFLGPGAAVIFAQFQAVNQFRSIGWYNVAWGLALIVLLFVMFRGESTCNKINRPREICCCTSHKSKSEIKPGPLQIFIVITILILSIIEMFRFGILETLFNPVLSDSFGLNERDSSYIFFTFGFPHVVGSILLYVLNKLKVSTQVTVFAGLLITIAGYMLLGDWQAIPYDPCTEYSPFHHPGIIQSETITDPFLNQNQTQSNDNVHIQRLPILKNIRLSSNIQLAFNDGSVINTHNYPGIKLPCERVNNCPVKQEISDTNFIASASMDFVVDTTGAILSTNTNKGSMDPNEAFLCSPPSLRMPSFQATVCVRIFQNHPSIASNEKSSPLLAHIESLQVLPHGLYWIARNYCMSANVTGHQCHWIPSSIIAKKECEDCQPICRSLHQIMTLPQFILGLGFLLLSNSLLWVGFISLIFNQLPGGLQGIVLGIRSTLNGINKTIIPLLLDAAYEGMQKRTFLIMAVIVSVHLPFLVEIIVLYRQLGPSAQERYIRFKDSESDCDLDNTEQ